ncbi:hypothetical protein DAPPUDRAFT_238136 [Daphnia pulex]|uniref:Uncharacterized protein n=1 Tax=Daphnia pulex TaxID=6669 RepID=E9G6Q8_DAPPU|nr:hypothetical protein DAPPUDRAFT_238136 [Daphnia pulex]|eukprot:EFX85150.1 hypothetical protein DAPPUDRAFT_238136 [Daphnia pulex]
MDFLIFNSRHRSPSDVAPAPGANETRSINPLAATPLFSPSSLPRAALFGLVVFIPRIGKSHQPKICRKAPVRQRTIVPPCQPGLVSNGKSHMVMDPSDMARRVVESTTYVVRRGS